LKKPRWGRKVTLVHQKLRSGKVKPMDDHDRLTDEQVVEKLDRSWNEVYLRMIDPRSRKSWQRIFARISPTAEPVAKEI
jgi:hypothetical protein